MGSWQLAVGSWQSAVGSGQWAVGSWQLAVGSGQWAVGSGQWAVGSGQLAIEEWSTEERVLSLGRNDWWLSFRFFVANCPLPTDFTSSLSTQHSLLSTVFSCPLPTAD